MKKKYRFIDRFFEIDSFNDGVMLLLKMFLIFSIVNSFMYPEKDRPVMFLFVLLGGIIYSDWISYQEQLENKEE